MSHSSNQILSKGEFGVRVGVRFEVRFGVGLGFRVGLGFDNEFQKWNHLIKTLKVHCYMLQMTP